MSPFVKAWRLEVNARRQARISACLGDTSQAASVLLGRLIRGLGMPRSLAGVGVSENQLPLIAEYTLEDFLGADQSPAYPCGGGRDDHPAHGAALGWTTSPPPA
jgi:alcohol dehydrogenase class IV